MTKNKLAIITDTNSGISTDEASHIGISLVPMPFIIDGETFYENIDLTQEEFFEKMEKGADITTSQPSLGTLMELWDELLKTNETILHIPMASSLSGSMASAHMLAEEYNGKVLVVDNLRVTVTLRQAVYDALKLNEEGFSAQEIKQKLERSSGDANIYLSVDTLEYLKKGGRITPAVAAIGSLLNIKPVLSFKNGVLAPYKKTRGKKAAWKEMIKAIEYDLEHQFKDQTVSICTAYSGSPALGEEWNQIVQEHFPNFKIYNSKLSLSLAAHTGPGICGIGCCVNY